MTRTLPVLASAALLMLSVAAHAADPAPRRLIVLGEGEASVRPDIAVLSLTVMREAPSAREALDADNKAMADVIAAMKASGIAGRDLQTAGVQISPRYDYSNKPDGTQEQKLIGYQVSNTLTVRLRDVSKAGEVLDKSVTLGVNQSGGISFTNDDPSAVLTEARRNAVADALAKARTLADAAGVRLGQVIEISDVAYTQPPQPIQAKAFDGGAAAVPVEAGENAYDVQVQVTFELD